MGDDLPLFAPEDWLSPEDARNLTASNADLLARNQVLQESLLKSETEVARLQGIINDRDRTWANTDREMHAINLANQAKQYEARLRELQERNDLPEGENKTFRSVEEL